MSDYGMIINGQKIHTENTFSVLNPANEEVLAECPIATREHLDQAVEAASKHLRVGQKFLMKRELQSVEKSLTQLLLIQKN